MLQTIGENAQFVVRVGQEFGEWFTSSIGTLQGDSLSPTTFITYLERVIQIRLLLTTLLERVMDGLQDNGSGISVH